MYTAANATVEYVAYNVVIVLAVFVLGVATRGNEAILLVGGALGGALSTYILFSRVEKLLAARSEAAA